MKNHKYKELYRGDGCPIDGMGVSQQKCLTESRLDKEEKGRCPFFSHIIIGGVACKHHSLDESASDGLEVPL